MGQNTPWIQLKAARVVFRLLFDAIDFADVEITEHFRERQLERGIDLGDINLVIKKGYVKKELRPDKDHHMWRWALYH